MHNEVFKPFFRLNEARTQAKAGAGLGLSIALDVARRHGGNISLAKSPLGGLRAHHLPTYIVLLLKGGYSGLPKELVLG